MIPLSQKIARIHQKKNAVTSLVSCPTPVLLDPKGRPYSPVRTNYFPHAQVLLATEIREEMKRRDIAGDVSFVDLKSLAEPAKWREALTPYGTLRYDTIDLTKCFIGNGMERVSELQGADVIGITSNFTSEANSVKRVIEKVTRLNPRAIIVVGGRDAASRPLFYKKIGADIVATGDSDSSFPRFVCGLVKKSPLLRTADARLDILSADSVSCLPHLDFTLLPNLVRYTESGSGDFFSQGTSPVLAAYLETSRGCDRDCDFCTERLTKRKNFDLTYMKEAVLHYKVHGIRTILFSDDNLLERLNGRNGEAELIEFFTFLREEQMIWEFSVGIEIGRFFDAHGKLRTDLLNALFWNNGDPTNWYGAFRMLAPFESLDVGLHLYTKMRSWQENLMVLDAVATCGIPQINMGVMFGWPNFSRADIGFIRARATEVKELLRSSQLPRRVNTGMNLSLFCTMPLPGTPFYEKMKHAGKIKYDIERHPELWNVFTSVLKGDTVSPEELAQIRLDLIDEFGSTQPHGKVLFQGTLIDDVLLEYLRLERSKIDDLDSRIIELVAKRIHSGRALVEWKTEHTLAKEDLERETAMLDAARLKARALSVDPTLIGDILQRIISSVKNT